MWSGDDRAFFCLDLHYSRFKQIRLALLSLLGVAVALWVATGGALDTAARPGTGAWIGRLLGFDGLQIVGWILAAVTASLALLYLSRASIHCVAVRASNEGLKIDTLFGSRFYAARHIDRLEIRRPAARPILQVIPRPGQGKMRGLALNGLFEDMDHVEAWIEAVHQFYRGRPSEQREVVEKVLNSPVEMTVV